MPKPLVDDDDALEELPPLDDDGEAETDRFDDPLDELDDAENRDDAETDDLALDDDLDELPPGDDADADDADVGEDEIDDDAPTLTREDAEAPGVGDEDFALGAPPIDADDGGEEGTFDEEPKAAPLPALDGDGDDGDGMLELHLLPPLRRAPLPPWQDAAWERATDAGSPPPITGEGTSRTMLAGSSGLVVAVATRPSRLLTSRDGGATWASREIVLSDGEPLSLVDPRIAAADEAIAIVDPELGVLVARGLDAPFMLAEGCSGATAAAFLGAAIDAPLVVAISGEGAAPAYLARVLDDGSAALIAEIATAGEARVEALTWDGALLWVALPNGSVAFRAPR